MNRDDILDLHRYHRWAHGLTLATVGTLSAEEQTRDLKSSFPSLVATLVHVLSAEWIWLQRWNGVSPTSWPEMPSLKTFAEVEVRWGDIEAEQTAYIESRSEQQLATRIAYRSLKGDPYEDSLADMIQHVVNHGTYHRGQIATMLRQLGYAPPSTDLIAYRRQR